MLRECSGDREESWWWPSLYCYVARVMQLYFPCHVRGLHFGLRPALDTSFGDSELVVLWTLSSVPEEYVPGKLTPPSEILILRVKVMLFTSELVITTCMWGLGPLTRTPRGFRTRSSGLRVFTIDLVPVPLDFLFSAPPSFVVLWFLDALSTSWYW